MKEKIGEHDQNEKAKKMPVLDKQLLLKKMQNFLKTVQKEENENIEEEAKNDNHFKRFDRTRRNSSRSRSSGKNRYSIHSRSNSLEIGYSRNKMKKPNRHSSDSGSRSSPERNKKPEKRRRRSINRNNKSYRRTERSDDSCTRHKIREHRDAYKVSSKTREKRNLKEREHRYSRCDSYSSNERYEKKCRIEHDERRDDYEPVHKDRRLDTGRTNCRQKQRSCGNSSEKRASSFSVSSMSEERSARRLKRRKEEHRSSPMNSRKRWEREKDSHDFNSRKHPKYVHGKSTNEAIKMKYFSIPLGFHTTKENWERYTQWLKQKNKYRFDLPFDEHKIYRRSSSLSPGTWERFVKDSDEDEKQTVTSDNSIVSPKKKHKKIRKKETPRESSEESNNSISSKSSCSSDSKDKIKERSKRHNLKKKHKKDSHKKRTYKKEEKKKRKQKKSKEKKKKHKKKRKKKKRKKVCSSESNAESIPSSVTSVSFLNEEWDLEDKPLVKKGVPKENKKKEENRGDTDKEEVKEKTEQLHTMKEDNMKNRNDEKRDGKHVKGDYLSIEKKEAMENQITEKKEDETKNKVVEESDDDSDIGPKPLDINVKLANKQISYGAAMMPGEGEAIAQFVQKGKRIPRRGEVGLSAEDIENYEKLGYVMSGSRHKRMNAIRMRKENQVYSAEEQRALAMYNYEERAIRENALINDLKEILRKQNEAIMNETQEGRE